MLLVQNGPNRFWMRSSYRGNTHFFRRDPPREDPGSKSDFSSLHIHCSQAMLHSAVWTLLHFTLPKSQFIKVHVNSRYSQVLSLPDTSGNGKDLLPVATLQYHKLRSCSYNILTHHLFFQVGFCPGYLPKTPDNKVRRALALA